MINIYKASAGSGKTFTLVREFLKLLLGRKVGNNRYALDEHPNENHRSILAITFTNKATEEMKKRIVKELDILAGQPDRSPYADFLAKALNAPIEKISKTAQVALVQLLQDYTNFNVSTIDTFFQKILRTFAYESNLSGNYEIELNDDYAISVGISDLKQSLRLNGGKDQRLLLGWLERFARANIDAEKSWDIFGNPSPEQQNTASLFSFAKVLSKEVVRKHRESLFDYLSDKQHIMNFGKSLSDAIDGLSKQIQERANVISGMLAADGVAPNSNFRNLIDKIKNAPIPMPASLLNSDNAILKYVDSGKFTNKGSAAVDDAGIAAMLVEMDKNFVTLNSFHLILNNIYYLGLLGDIYGNIRQFTKDNNVILLSDTNEMLRRIINADDTPFVYERMGVRLRHFLIDEFQDTSGMQWENLRPLLANSLAGGNDNLVIGDVKQCIYRFRNSNPELLRTQIKADFRGNCVESGNDPESNTNWRSSENVVKWNNDFFQWLAHVKGMDDVYDNVVQRISDSNKGNFGHVCISEIEGSCIPEYQEAALNKMLDDIDRLLDAGYEQKDIAVITSRRIEGKWVIDRILGRNSSMNGKRRLNIVSEESLFIGKSSAVRIIVNMLALLDETVNAKSDKKAGAKSIPFIMKRYETNLCAGMDVADAFAAAVQAENDVDMGEAVAGMFGAGECGGLDTIVYQIIRTQLPKALVESDTVYIQAFIDNLIDFTSRYGSNVHSFLRWWEETGKKQSVSSPDNINAIRTLTIHKSKGLEFPCVILPFFDWEFDKPANPEWIRSADIKELSGFEDRPPLLPVARGASDKKRTIFDKEFKCLRDENVMDTLNKTYVACTRAIDELLIYYPSRKTMRKKDTVAHAIGDYAETLQLESYAQTRMVEFGSMGRSGARTSKSIASDVEERKMPPFAVAYRPEIWHFDSPDIIQEVKGTNKYKGEVLHRVMCKIRTADDVDRALRGVLVKGIIDAAEEAEYRRIIAGGLSDERVAAWFAPGNKLYAERPVANEKGEVYRPDRVVVRPNGEVVVVDYKFGERQDKKYMRQVRNYMAIVAAAMGVEQSQVKGFVWYVEEGAIIAVG